MISCALPRVRFHLPAVRRGQRGFTLIEVMFATAFFLIVLSAIYGIQLTAKRMSENSRNYDLASTVLVDMSELVQVWTPAKLQLFINSGTGQWFTKTGAPVASQSADRYFQAIASILPDAGTFKQIALTVQWTDPGASTSRSVTSNLIVNLP